MKSLKGIIYAMISSGTFGLIPLFTIPLMGNMEMNESNILFYRFLFSTLMMGAVCLLHKSTLKINMKHLISIIGLGALYALTALFLIMVVFFKEEKSKSLFLAASLSLIGVALMCWSGGGSIRLMGIGLAALTILTYGIYIVALNQLDIGKLPAEVLTFYVLLGGCVIFFIYSLFTAGISSIPSTKAGFYILALAFLSTVISDLTLILAVKYAGSTTTAILGSMEPLVAVVVGVLVFSEHFTLQSLIGLLLILMSVIIVILADQQKKSKRITEQKIIKPH